MNDAKIWFPAKRYGWGWGLPCAWQGWVVLAAYVGAAAGLALGLLPTHPTAYGWAMGAATALLLALCWWKGEPPAWRWGGPDR